MVIQKEDWGTILGVERDKHLFEEAYGSDKLPH